MKKFTLLFTLISAMLIINSQMFAQNTYFQFASLNYSSVDVGSDWTKLGTGNYTFTKGQDDSQVEVYLNSRFGVGDINGAGVKFMVRMDDVIDPDYDNKASIRNANSDEFESIFAVFENLPAGNHTVSVWALAPNGGSATSVLVDPGGWEGRIIVKIINDNTVSVPEPASAPGSQIMQQNYPNPFYPETTIEYVVQQQSQVVLSVYNNAGQLVKTLVDEYKAPGEYSVVWDSKDKSGKTVSSGSYFYQIRVGNFVSSRKMIVLK